MDKVEQRAWELLEAECGKPLPFDIPVHAALHAVTAALAQQTDDIASGGCTTDGADVWCNGHIVATARGLTLAPYRAARIAACVNACAGIEDPVAFIQKAKRPHEPLAHSRSVTRQLMHWGGVPVHVTGTVTTSPGNWSLIDAALTGERNG
jgi:hypothetical protein